MKASNTTISLSPSASRYRSQSEVNRLRKYLLSLVLTTLAVLTAVTATAQSNYTGAYYFTTFAGNPNGGDGTGSQAGFSYPYATAVDSAGNVYVADTNDQTIRKITSAGVVTTLAGFTGLGCGYADGTGSDARFCNPEGIAVDTSGNVYVSDAGYSIIRKITPAGVVTTIAGTAGVSGSADGTGAAAQFYNPWGIAVDGSGNLYVADYGNSTIRKITPAGVVTTLAGSPGVTGSANGTGSAARFSNAAGVAVNSAGTIIYVADTGNYTIRKVTSAAVVTTFAGTAGAYGSADGTGSAAQFSNAYGVGIDSSGNIYVGDSSNSTIRKITSAGVVTTFAGTAGVYGSANGTGSAAQFSYPYGVAADAAGNLYVADYYNQEIRKITSARVVTTLAGSTTYPPSPGSANGTGRAARFYYPYGVAVGGTTSYVADTYNGTIRKITSTGVVTTLAGTAGVFGSADGTGSAAQFYYPYGVAADTKGNVYVADTYNYTIRKITSTGVVTTLAGTAGVAGYADGTGSAAQFNTPYSVAVDSTGSNVYVADVGNQSIRKIVVSTGAVTTLAGSPNNGCGYADGTGSAASFCNPEGVAVDSSGNVYVSDAGYAIIRKITPAGVVTTVAGTPGVYGSADGTKGSAQFNNPWGIAVDKTKNLYVADYNNSTIRKITATGVVTTLGGVPGRNGLADRTGSNARFYNAIGIAVDGTGKLYVADTYNSIIRNGVLADLKIGNTDGKTTVAAGSMDTYTITVTNTGLEGITGSVATDNFPATFTNPSFTATAKGGATGFASGSGNINQTVSMPPGSSITYKATGVISGTATSGTVILNTASVSVPAGVQDPNTKDNTATDKDTVQ